MLLIQAQLANQNLSHAQRISRTQTTVEPLSLEMTVSTMAQHSNEIQGNVTKNRRYVLIDERHMEGCESHN